MKSLIRISFFIIIFIQAIHVVAQVCPAPVPAQYEHVQPGSVVAGYFGSWDIYGGHKYTIEQIEDVADKLTHVVYGFMKPDELNARCVPHDIWADLGAYDDVQTKVSGNFAKMLKLKQKFPHLKILLSIGGGTYNKNFATLIKDRDKLMQFARSCVDILDFYDHTYKVEGAETKINHLTYEGLFDGLDIDWEWLPSQLNQETAILYRDFIQELSRLLQKRSKNSLLTVALQATQKIYNTLQVEKIAPYINWFHVMAYDFYGPQSGVVGFNAQICNANVAYSVDGVLQALMERGVSPEKLVLGLPLYGYVYEDSAGYKSTIKRSQTSKALAYQMSYHVLKNKYLDNPDFKKGWNSAEKAASAYNKKDRIFISYDDGAALQEKVKLAKYKKLQGIVVWRLSGDDQKHTIVKALYKAMQ